MLIRWLVRTLRSRGNCTVLLASASSKKALAIAYSIKKLLKCRIIGLFTGSSHPYMASRLIDVKAISKSLRGSREWVLEVGYVGIKHSVNLIIPVDFIDIITLTKYLDILHKLGLRVAAPEHDKVLLASDKSRLSKLLEGICDTPKTLLPSESQNKLKNLRAPIVIKGSSDASKPVYLNKLEDINTISRDGNFIMQEFFPGIDRGYFTVAFDGLPLIEFTHQRTVEYDPIGGASLMSYGPVLDPKLYRIGREITKRLRWVGPLMVETRWNPERGNYVVLEINPKFWGSIDLPVKLNYHLPAVLVAAFLYGMDYAKNLVRELQVKSGMHAWVLDGIRYLGKDLSTWLKILRAALNNPILSDLSPLDPGRVLMQVIRGLVKLPGERRNWVKGLNQDLMKVRNYVRRASSRIKNSELNKALLILDLDGTLVDLNIPWGKIKDEGFRKGYITRGESIFSGLTRLWFSNRSLYSEFSKLIESYEMKAVDKYVTLIDEEDIKKLLKLMDRGLRVCIVTKQSSSSARTIINKLFMSHDVQVIGRDYGNEPVKASMFAYCSKLLERPEVVVLDDNFTAVIDAFRSNYISVRAVRSNYELVRTLRLGLPALPPSKAFKFVTKLLSILGQEK